MTHACERTELASTHEYEQTERVMTYGVLSSLYRYDQV